MSEEEKGGAAWPFERKCPECKKLFVVHQLDEWGYTIGVRKFCSYGCMRKYEKRRDQQEIVRRNAATARPRKISTSKLNPHQKQAVVKMFMKMGKSNAEIARLTDISDQLVNHYRRKIENEEALERVRQGIGK